jgi:hypothetical protein
MPPGFAGFMAMHPPPPPPPGFAPPQFPDVTGLSQDEARKVQRRAWRRWFRETFGEDAEKRCHKAEK